MIIGIPIYQQVDLLDVAAPVEIFGNMKENAPQLEVEIVLIAEDCEPVVSRAGVLLTPQKCFDEVAEVDVLWVPGGDPSALNKIMHDPKRTYLDFLITRSAKARYVASVCEGAMLLAQAGLLDGYLATTHWAFIPCFKRFPAIKVAEGYPRFVVDRNRVTGGGISSGLDEALKMVELLAGYEVAQQVQQFTQYYPSPPVASTIPPTNSCPLDASGGA
jgi:transcriptional regulator GlxA family with amidase domain